MPTLTIAYDHSRDPMNPDDLADRLVAQFNLTTVPAVDINPTQIVITHPQAIEQNRAAIQGIIDAYVIDPVRAKLPNGAVGTLQRKALAAIDANTTYLGHSAIPAGTLTLAQLSAIVRTLSDQVDALTRQNTAELKIALGLADDLTGT